MPYQSITPPIITIQFESMKHAIMQHMAMHTAEMQETLDLELTRAIEQFDLAGYIHKIVAQILQEQIKRAVESRLYEVIYNDKDFEKEITHMIGMTVREVFKK